MGTGNGIASERLEGGGDDGTPIRMSEYECITWRLERTIRKTKHGRVIPENQLKFLRSCSPLVITAPSVKIILIT